jgi:hypothetical protein
MASSYREGLDNTPLGLLVTNALNNFDDDYATDRFMDLPEKEREEALLQNLIRRSDAITALHYDIKASEQYINASKEQQRRVVDRIADANANFHLRPENQNANTAWHYHEGEQIEKLRAELRARGEMPDGSKLNVPSGGKSRKVRKSKKARKTRK